MNGGHVPFRGRINVTAGAPLPPSSVFPVSDRLFLTVPKTVPFLPNNKKYILIEREHVLIIYFL